MKRLVDWIMTQRSRKLAGTLALFVLIGAYVAVALAVAIVMQVNNANKIAELVFYAVAGLLWVIPAAVIVRWMQKPDAGS